MEFKNDILTLDKPSNTKFGLNGVNLPSSNDISFRSKQQELVEQYSAARIFMNETDTDDWNHWFNSTNDKITETVFRLKYRSHFYEIALFYYNAVVDISWVLCYVAAEFAYSKKGVRVPTSGMKSIAEAYELLRIAEQNVTEPTAKTNPFKYLKKMCPEFVPAIDQIIDFWKSFASTNIRNKYNYCKHRGRPAYSEIEILTLNKSTSIYVENKSSEEFTEIASSIGDVRNEFSLEEAIRELKEFDETKLFPYLKKLIETIERILEPSPMIC